MKFFQLTALTVGLLLFALITIAQTTTDMTASMQTIHVTNAYINAAPPISKITAGFFEIHNHSDQTATLIAATSSIAKKIEIHHSSVMDKMMSMQKIDALEIPAHDSIALTPGGLHLMLSGLQRPLQPGETLSLTLQFLNQQAITIQAHVQDIRTPDKHHPAHQHHNK